MEYNKYKDHTLELLILNEKLEAITFVDRYKSAIWTDRYREAGDFELLLPCDGYLADQLQYLQPDYYLVQNGGPELEDRAMIIEGFLTTTDVSDGSSIKVTGSSLESILKRRIIWDTTILTGSLQDGIETLINNAIISPSLSDRKIDNFIFVKSTDKAITDLTVDTQYDSHDNLYDAITALCEEKDIGFKVTLNRDTNQFEFRLYKGTDRSYDQIENPYVVFSPSYDNISNTSYLENKADYKNVCFVSGEDSESQETQHGKPILTKVIGSASGLGRRETYTDAGSLTLDDENHPHGKLTEAEKQAILEQKANEALTEALYVKSMEGEVDPYSMFTYGVDFGMGDKVQIENEYGIRGTSTISEYIMSDDEGGYTAYPTFTEFRYTEN